MWHCVSSALLSWWLNLELMTAARAIATIYLTPHPSRPQAMPPGRTSTEQKKIPGVFALKGHKRLSTALLLKLFYEQLAKESASFDCFFESEWEGSVSDSKNEEPEIKASVPPRTAIFKAWGGDVHCSFQRGLGWRRIDDQGYRNNLITERTPSERCRCDAG